MTNTNYLFLIGAPKAGTTSIAAAFADHPAVAVAAGKEPRYFTDFADRTWRGPKAHSFATTMTTDWDDYAAQFGTGRWRLDASTDYLSCPVTPPRLAAFAERNPVKVVAVLRDPVARVLSEYQHTLRDGYQTISLAESLAAEDKRVADGWHPLFHHIRRSRYAAPIARYRSLFGADFHILDFHAAGGHRAILSQLAQIMGIAPHHAQVPRDNVSYSPRSATLNTLMQADAVRQMARRVLPDELRGRLRRAAQALNGTQYRVTQAELATMRAALADDIAWCLADPDVPTAHWALSCGAAEQVADPSRPRLDVQP
ncbi:MAG: hypothetical protein AAFP98_09640 [Pseudomonadota bacterium]